MLIAVSCLGLPAPVLAEPELADSRSVRDGATGFIDEVLGLADDAPLCASPSPPPLSPSPSSTVTLIPDTLESTPPGLIPTHARAAALRCASCD